MSYDVTINRLPRSALFDLRGRGEAIASALAPLGLALPEQPNTAVRQGSLELFWVGPEHWLLRAPADEEARLSETLLPASEDAETSLVLVSDAYAVFAVTGPEADEVLAAACPLDRRPGRFPSDGVSFTEAFGLKALLIQRPAGAELAVESSYAELTADRLARVTGL